MSIASPVWQLPPLDYRYALDGAAMIIPTPVPLVKCNVAALEREVWSRFPLVSAAGPAESGLWVEPLWQTWRCELALFAQRLSPGALLAVMFSMPLARLLPERKQWPEEPLCVRIGGVRQLLKALDAAGFVIELSQRIHTLSSMGLGLTAFVASQLRRPDIADRLSFAARLQYAIPGSPSLLTAVALLVARRRLDP